MTAFCERVISSGEMTGRRIVCADPELLAENARDGCEWIESDDMPQPSKPDDSAFVTWTWGNQLAAWVPTLTAAANAANARAERDRRLSACDWTQLPDVPAPTAATWAAYRQALRDVTAQPGFPESINWPEAPQ